jgi:hypothetical protein
MQRQRAAYHYRQPLCLVLFIAAFATLAATGGTDTNWDLRNYHLYNAFAALNGKLGFDLVPAQVQTFLAPQLDLVYYFWFRLLNHQPILLNCVLSIPHGVCAYITWRLTLRFVPADVPFRGVLCVVAAVIGATGASALPTLAATDSDLLPGSLCLGGLLVILRAREKNYALRQVAAAGLLFGLAAGFKLTAAPYCLGATAVLMLQPGQPLRRRLTEISIFGLVGIAALLVVAGPWWLLLESKYGSPLFPYFNRFFQSPLYFPVNISDDRFKPRDVLHAVFLPFYWAFHADSGTTELPMRDPRLAVAFCAVIVSLIRLAVSHRRRDPEVVALTAFTVVAYVMWEKEFSIVRYLAVLEFLSATLVLAAVIPSDPAPSWRWAPWPIMIVFGVLCFNLTVYPDWGRARTPGAAIEVKVPPLPNDAVVVMLDDAPMGYVAAFYPRSVRFIGANNNLLPLGQITLLQQQVVAAIRDARGPVFGLEDAVDNQKMADKTLSYYHLRRDGVCAPVQSNLDGNSLRICPLMRER